MARAKASTVPTTTPGSASGKLIVRPTPNPNFRRVDAQVFNEVGEPLLTLSTVLGRY